eukprot:CAMPEP_0168729240 /NCGR_PEP_ID=MMETSP0724-20121128/6097_1 /TAXON_ID=265536 /ORGANISM="Amphiprora sp., Strain CCMP467" /LENGTH=410 /DNA_ID=CAMNT_0008776109 /DNA_START=36 /DNA_END=1268 /DNA_ORIENTATION=+
MRPAAISTLVQRRAAAVAGMSRTMAHPTRSHNHNHGLRMILPLTSSLSTSSSSSTTKMFNHDKRTLQDTTSISATSTMSHRSFSTQPTKKDKKSKNDNKQGTEELSYFARKAAAKEERRAKYEAKISRKERLITRRAGRNRGMMRKQFDAFFKTKLAMEKDWCRKAEKQGLDWNINVAVLLERPNVHLPPEDDWEAEFFELEAHLDTVRGRDLPDYFKYGPKDEAMEGFDDISDADDEKKKQEDEEEDLLNPPDIHAEPTEADLAGDIRTIDRKLGDRIYLVVKEEGSVGEPDSDIWHFPTVKLGEEETLLEAARRALTEKKVEPSVVYWCPSKAPWSVRLTRFPKDERDKSGIYGTKTFFMKLQHFEGDLPKDDLGVIKDFAWMDRGEVASYMEETLGEYHGKFYHYML